MIATVDGRKVKVGCEHNNDWVVLATRKANDYLRCQTCGLLAPGEALRSYIALDGPNVLKEAR